MTATAVGRPIQIRTDHTRFSEVLTSRTRVFDRSTVFEAAELAVRPYQRAIMFERPGGDSGRSRENATRRSILSGRIHVQYRPAVDEPRKN